MSQFNHFPQDNYGESKLVASLVISGNTEYHIATVDWANALITTTVPHGIAVSSNQSVCVVPNYHGFDNWRQDILSIPIEMITGGSIVLVGIDSTTLRMTSNTSGTNNYAVNISGNENLNNVDITKFHFEIPNPISLTNFPPMRNFLIRTIGYEAKTSNYKYITLDVVNNDGTTNNHLPYFGEAGSSTVFNSYYATFAWMDHHIRLVNDWQYSWQLRGQRHGRRYNYNGFEDATSGTDNYNLLMPVSTGLMGCKGITGFQTYGNMLNYAYLCNGATVQVFDLGGV